MIRYIDRGNIFLVMMFIGLGVGLAVGRPDIGIMIGMVFLDMGLKRQDIMDKTKKLRVSNDRYFL